MNTSQSILHLSFLLKNIAKGIFIENNRLVPYTFKFGEDITWSGQPSIRHQLNITWVNHPSCLEVKGWCMMARSLQTIK